MNNSIADWNMIVSEDKFIKKIDLLNKRLEYVDILNKKIEKLECKLDKFLDKEESENFDKNDKYNILETKIDSLSLMLNNLDKKIEYIKENKSDTNLFNTENISQYLDLNIDNDNDNEKNNENMQENSNLYNKNIIDNISTNLFNNNSLSLGLKSIINQNNTSERIKNTLWRRNIINYNSSNYYTTTPNIKYNIN